jgi:hypothetical protein
MDAKTKAMEDNNGWIDAQEICEKLYKWVTPQFRAGLSIRINGGTYSDLIDHSDWREGKHAGFAEGERLIKEGKIFFVYPFECEREGCPTRFQYGGYWACNNCNTHINTPDWWKIKVMKDGDQFCCIGIGFINLQESQNYAFGKSFQDAINNYWHSVIRRI